MRKDRDDRPRRSLSDRARAAGRAVQTGSRVTHQVATTLLTCAVLVEIARRVARPDCHQHHQDPRPAARSGGYPREESENDRMTDRKTRTLRVAEPIDDGARYYRYAFGTAEDGTKIHAVIEVQSDGTGSVYALDDSPVDAKVFKSKNGATKLRVPVVTCDTYPYVSALVMGNDTVVLTGAPDEFDPEDGDVVQVDGAADDLDMVEEWMEENIPKLGWTN